jgi:PadR family transcriptional regulator
MPGGYGWGHGRHYCRRQGWQPSSHSLHGTSFLIPHLLLALRDTPSHGYTLLEEVKSFGLGELDPSVVYRALREMEVDGLVASSTDDTETQGPPRRVYRLTADGRRALALWAADLEQTQGAIARFLDQFHKPGSPRAKRDEGR